MAAGDYKFVPLVQYGEANSTGYSSSAYSRSDTFFLFLTKGGVGYQPTGPKAIPQTILIRATGIGTAPCDYACRIWVQDPDGRLRIADSNTSTGTVAAPAGSPSLRTGDAPAPASDKTISRLMKRLSIREVNSHLGPIDPQNIVTVPELRTALTEAVGGDTREAAIVTAVRAALRVLPLAAEHIVKEPRLAAAVPVDAFTSALLRTAAISWVSAIYPNNSDRFGVAVLAALADLNVCRSRIRPPRWVPTIVLSRLTTLLVLLSLRQWPLTDLPTLQTQPWPRPLAPLTLRAT